MPLDPVFASFTTQLDGLFLDSVPSLVARAVGYVREPLRAALGLYVVLHIVDMILGNGSARDLGWAFVRGVVVAAALQLPNYTEYVSDAFLTRLPAEIAGALNGKLIVASAAEQFDILRAGMANLKAQILMQANGAADIGERLAAHIIDGAGWCGIAVMWWHWYLPRVLTGLVVVVGPFLIPLWLFEAARGFAMAFAAKLVSLLALSVGASVVIASLLATIDRVAAPIGVGQGASVDALLVKLLAVAGMMWFGAFLMRSLPPILSLNSSVGAAANALVGASVQALTAPFTAAGRALRGLGR